MLWQYFLVHTSVFASAAFAASLKSVLHEKRDTPLPSTRQRIDGDSIIPVRIGLRQSNLHTGYEKLMDVSHPSSENYGKHLTKEEVHSLFAPAEETIESVKSWLLRSDLVNASQIVHYENKGWLAIDMPAKDAESLLKTTFYEVEGIKGDVRIGCDEYYLPAHISSHVDYIKPGVKLSAPMRKRDSSLKKRSSGHAPGIGFPPRIPPPHYPGWTIPPAAKGLLPELQNCGVNITPACIKALYDIPNAVFKQPENAMGLFETYDAFSQEDVSLFFQHFATNVPADTKPNVISVDGGTAPVAPADARNGGESDIDIDLATSIIYPQSVTVYEVDDLYYSTQEAGNDGFLNTFLDSIDGSYCNYSAFGITGDSPGIDASYPDNTPGGFKGQRECGTYELTRVVSISYGEAEFLLPKAYVERQCNEILKLGLQGHTILVASGDYGVASFPGGGNGNYEGCMSSDTLNGTIYNPDYPSGCPYITAVGATRLYPNDTVHDPESAMQVNLTAFNLATGSGPTTPPYDWFATGGGFSNYFTPASFQAKAVADYLKKDLPYQNLSYYEINSDGSNIGENGGIYNRIGRGYPDVSANGAFLLTYVNVTQGTFFGTSLASPIFGAVVTLINEERTAVGKGPIGFISPALYANPSVLNDITNGSNPNCGSEGFQASEGWDPVTGLGTPNYPRMLEYFLSLP